MSHAAEPTAEPTQRGEVEKLRAAAAEERRQWLARETAWSWGRLAAFALALAPWLIYPSHTWSAAATTLAALVVFVVLVWRHTQVRQRREDCERLLLVCEETLQRWGGSVTCIRSWQRPDDDAEVDAVLPTLLAREPAWKLTEQERDDLDVFAPPVGIFGLLNRTATVLGARRLRDALEAPLLAREPIGRRQAAVRWLAEHGPQRLRMMAALSGLRSENARLAGAIRALRDVRPVALLPPYPVWVPWSFALLTSALLAPMLGTKLLVAVVLINVTLYVRMRTRLRACLDPWQDVSWALRGCLRAAQQGAADLPDAGELGLLRAHLAALTRRGVLPHLERRAAWTESGGLAHVLANVAAFLDVHLTRSLLKCVLPHREELRAGLAALGELDALLSIAALAAEQPVTCWPEPAATTGLDIEAGVHPLIAPTAAVGNDVRLSPSERLWIITGSNMAGKSTFLRMTGVNVLLAQLGGPALARRMCWSPLRIMTDLRVRDSLAAGESYYLAEVRHLRRLLRAATEDVPLLGLVDEPFRGTNSDDQSAASLAVLQDLLRSGQLFIVATHDWHLTRLAEGRTARNFHFRENLDAAGLVFDYRLHDGPAQTRNALRILEREEYPADLVARAHQWLNERATRSD